MSEVEPKKVEEVDEDDSCDECGSKIDVGFTDWGVLCSECEAKHEQEDVEEFDEEDEDGDA